MRYVTTISRDALLKLGKDKKIYLEGNILKILKAKEDDTDFQEYLQFCIDRDLTSRRKRLEVTKQVQRQYTELETAMAERERLMNELQQALEEAKCAEEEATRLKNEAESAKNVAVQDLELMQKRKQFELIGTIVKSALYIIIGVGGVTSGLFVYALYRGIESPIIESTWSNLFGILLTNAFSIIGTIMGVKYAQEQKSE
jgi:hypothetical protein